MEKEQVLEGLKEVYRTRPNIHELQKPTEDTRVWIGTTNAILSQVGSSISSSAESIKGTGTKHTGQGADFFNNNEKERYEGNYERIEQTLINEITKLELVIGATAIPVGEGKIFTYHTGVRKIVEAANTEVFFVDLYISADFVSDYLADIPSHINIRVLTSDKAKRALDAALTSAKILKKQNGSDIQIRVGTGMHDRHVFIDGQTCYMTGASIKDGAKNAPTTIIKITDAFAATLNTYETMWASGINQSLT